MRPLYRQALLGLSLGLNLALGLAFYRYAIVPAALGEEPSAAIARGPRGEGRGSRGGGRGSRGLEKKLTDLGATIGLTDEQMTRYRQQFDALREGSSANVAAMRDQRLEELLALVEHPDDAALLEATREKGRKLQGDMAAGMYETLRGIVRDLTPDQRQRLAEELRREPPEMGPPPPHDADAGTRAPR